MNNLSGRDFQNIQRKLADIQQLPTVQRGVRALGLNSVFEWFVARERIADLKSEFTHRLHKPMLYLPGLRATMIYDNAEFPWVQQLEAAFPEIQAELDALLASRAGFQPYRLIENDEFVRSNERYGKSAEESPDWNMFYFNYMGRRLDVNCERCPRTAAILESIPRFCRQTIASFSALNPNTNLVPHFGPTNAVLRVHLGLKVPQGCGIRVGTERAGWQEGKVLVFSDAFEHEVWHRGRETRFVLFFDVLHPDFSDQELPAVEAFLRNDGADGLADFWGRMQSLRDADARMLEGRQWWT
jgi:aspartyl/asparaginyl beta-hydroxylase (cupin superfamily)